MGKAINRPLADQAIKGSKWFPWNGENGISCLGVKKNLKNREEEKHV
jgi:hypothetical protein